MKNTPYAIGYRHGKRGGIVPETFYMWPRLFRIAFVHGFMKGRQARESA